LRQTPLGNTTAFSG